jgi:hypothetical protein
LATTSVPGCRINAADSAAATPRTSLPRSSWSRLRLSTTITCGSTASATAATYSSSTSSTAKAASGCAANAATTPSGIFAPMALWATGPTVRSNAASRWLVVVLPLVPDTSTLRRPHAKCRKTRGSRASATRPPMIAPAPRPSRRDSPAGHPPAPTASLVRTVLPSSGMAPKIWHYAYEGARRART